MIIMTIIIKLDRGEKFTIDNILLESRLSTPEKWFTAMQYCNRIFITAIEFFL
jgi:hypothetical protein